MFVYRPLDLSSVPLTSEYAALSSDKYRFNFPRYRRGVPRGGERDGGRWSVEMGCFFARGRKVAVDTVQN